MFAEGQSTSQCPPYSQDGQYMAGSAQYRRPMICTYLGYLWDMASLPNNVVLVLFLMVWLGLMLWFTVTSTSKICNFFQEFTFFELLLLHQKDQVFSQGAGFFQKTFMQIFNKQYIFLGL